MKVGIITIVDYDNYGNRLQSYAVQKVLKNIDIDSETIEYDTNLNHKDNIIIYSLKAIKNYLKKIKKNNKKNINPKRRNNFLEFSKHIKTVRKPLMLLDRKISNKYDYFIVGSDQIWNPNFGKVGDIEFLTFAEKNKSIAYAPSFGVESIQEKYKEFCGKALEDFKSISVREDAGKKIIENLTSRKDVEVLVDPTMMLTKLEWMAVEKRPECLKSDNFIFGYFLGNVSKERMEYIRNIAKEENAEIINIMDKDSEFYTLGPSEFIYLINNAKLVCSDSFHACVFSIIFKKDFIVFDREDKNVPMNSRIDTLLNKFELQDRKYKDSSSKFTKINYVGTDNIIEKERKKAYDFLRNSMEL